MEDCILEQEDWTMIDLGANTLAGFEGGDYVCFSIETLYERKALDQSLPFFELKARRLINTRAKAAGEDAAFSARIREGLPGFTHAGNPGKGGDFLPELSKENTCS